MPISDTPYKAKLSTKAQDRLLNMSERLRAETIGELLRLLEHPVKLSRSSRPPMSPPGYQEHVFTRVIHGSTHLVKILFRYMTDEIHLWIDAIGHVEYRHPDQPS